MPFPEYLKCSFACAASTPSSSKELDEEEEKVMLEFRALGMSATVSSLGVERNYNMFG